MTITIDIRRLAFTATAAVLMASLGAAVYATIPDAEGLIHGCYHRTTGALRLIDSSNASCQSVVEKPIAWDQGNGAGVRRISVAMLQVGDSLPLFTSGPFAVSAACTRGPNPAGDFVAILRISTTDDGSAYGNSYPDLAGQRSDAHQDGNFGPSDGPQILARLNASELLEAVPFSAVDSGDHQLSGQLWQRVLSSGDAATCSFGGYYVEG